MEYARKIVLLKNLLEELQLETSKITVEETFAILNDLKETVNSFNDSQRINYYIAVTIDCSHSSLREGMF